MAAADHGDLIGRIGRQTDADARAVGAGQAHAVALAEVAADGHDAGGQQALTRTQGGDGARIQRQGAAGRHAAGDPLFPRGQRGGGGQDQAGAGAVQHGRQRMVGQARSDDGCATGRGGDLGSRQLGRHAAGADPGLGVGAGRHGQNVGRQALDQRQVTGVRIATRIGGVEAVHVGQQDQQIGPAELRRARGQAVVVAVSDLFGGDGVILIDDWDDAVSQQSLQRGAAVEPAAPPFGVVAGQQHLSRHQTVGRKGLFPGVHQQGLAHGGGGLFVLKAAGRQVQSPAPQSHGAGRDDDDIATLSAQVGDVGGQAGQPVGGDGASIGVEQERRADLDHHPARLDQSGGGGGGGRKGFWEGGGGGHSACLSQDHRGSYVLGDDCSDGRCIPDANRRIFFHCASSQKKRQRKRPAGEPAGRPSFSSRLKVRLRDREPVPNRPPGP